MEALEREAQTLVWLDGLTDTHTYTHTIHTHHLHIETYAHTDHAHHTHTHICTYIHTIHTTHIYRHIAHTGHAHTHTQTHTLLKTESHFVYIFTRIF